MATREFDRPLSVAMLALGGQGGGVLTGWLVDIAENAGWYAQSTFVAGVAQRTGATVYCVEMLPRDAAAGKGEPVFTPYPVPGDVDLVIAGELAETGRAVLKGFVTPNATTLIASTHRVYSIDEKSAPGDGIRDQSRIVEFARTVSKRFIGLDMAAAANATNSIISAVMLGTVAASGALPFSREDFEAAIRRDGRAVESNLAGFAAGYDAAENGEQYVARTPEPAAAPAAEGPAGAALLERCAPLPEPVAALAAHGALRALDYQDRAYADRYLDTLDEIVALDSEARGYALATTVARNLALQMCYEDTLRVAELKTRGSRFARVRDHLAVDADTPAYVVEYFHPRFAEFCDTLPAAIGDRLRRSTRIERLLAPLFGPGRNITTNKLGGYLLLSTLARGKRWRRGTLRYREQWQFIDDWLQRIRAAAADDYDLALAIARTVDLVRGYGDTFERGMSRYRDALAAASRRPDGERAAALAQLHTIAQHDETGRQFDRAVAELGEA